MSGTISLFASNNPDNNGFPILSMDGFRIAESEFASIPAIKSEFSIFSSWISDTIKFIYNAVYKDNYERFSILKCSVLKLGKHRIDGTYPPFIIKSFSGVSDTSYHTDKCISSELRNTYLATIEEVTHVARNGLLNQIIDSKKYALQKRQFLCSSINVLCSFRDRIIENLTGMNKSLNVVDSELPQISRALCCRTASDHNGH